MADTTVDSSTPTPSSFSLSAHKETATLLLTLLAPPAAIAIHQGKVDLHESRHLAASLALYLSVLFYLPAVAHAYWLIYIRDNGGLEEWTGARVGQARGLWNDHGGVVKERVDEYSGKVVDRVDKVRSYTNEKVNYATAKKDEAVSFISDKRSAATDFYSDAKEAYASGHAIDWVKEKIVAVYEFVKTRLESYPRAQAIINYLEIRVPQAVEYLHKIYETIRAKLTPSASSTIFDESILDDSTITCEENALLLPEVDREVVPEVEKTVVEEEEKLDDSLIQPTSEGTDIYETAEDSTMDQSFLEGEEEEGEDVSQEL